MGRRTVQLKGEGEGGGRRKGGRRDGKGDGVGGSKKGGGRRVDRAAAGPANPARARPGSAVGPTYPARQRPGSGFSRPIPGRAGPSAARPDAQQTVISNLLGAVTSLLKDKVNLILNAKDELKQLQGKLERLQKALKDADRKPFFSNERNRDLEGELKGIFYDAQDIIEDYQTIIELSEREKSSITSWKKADDKEKVKELLFDGSTESSVPPKHGVSIVSIVGQGGIGKTTLAKMVFKEVEEQFGKRRWWVCVSHKPNPMNLLQKILKEVCKGCEREIDGITSFSDLCTRLQSELSNNKFLLVLDDVWELDWWWGEVEDTLMGGAKESKILITSRKVLGIHGKMHKLSEMTFDESWRLFLDVALKEENELVSHNLKGTGERIVGRCGGLPLVVKTDHVIEMEKLVMQWVAHGLIDQKKGSDVEVTANQCIDDLINLCMIEEMEYKDLKLHDILHDLASYIGGKEYSHASPTEYTRHLSLLDVNNAELTRHNASSAANKSRTLLTASLRSLPSVHFTNFKRLRVLSLKRCEMVELPNSIESLSLLKYLDLSYSNVRWLPNSIGRLCNLQTLDLDCSQIEELPKEMGELCNLRHLGLECTVHLNFIAEGLGKLTNLRTLRRFLVCDDKGGTRGCNIGELKELNKLKGHLSIEGLGRGMVKVIGAKKAHLKEKHELNSVELAFKVGDDDKMDIASEHRGLLEALEPPHGIENLAICDYEGKRQPVWYLDTNYVELRTLRLQHCTSWTTVIGTKSLAKLEVNTCPMLYELLSMPLLKSLSIFSCEGLNTIADMPSLRH
ncbi:putative disease resistance protein [Nymphaea thermarum]|nr:putative disease resistance protein [Nymphaea thermarum]